MPGTGSASVSACSISGVCRWRRRPCRRTCEPDDLAGEQVGAERAARARGAGGGDDHDVVRLDQAAGREQRREREDRRGGVAAGGGDGAGGLDLLPRAGAGSSGRP